jgi:hypothetical protein
VNCFRQGVLLIGHGVAVYFICFSHKVKLA